MTNVMGDSLGAGIVNHFSVDEMPPLDHEMYDTDLHDIHDSVNEKMANGIDNTTPV